MIAAAKQTAGGKDAHIKNTDTALCAEKSLTVNESNTAAAAKSGSLAVLGTPFMLALMEEATCAAAAPLLEEGETTVGTAVSITHDRASGIGERITARAVLKEAQGRRLVFEVSAENEKGEKIGGGTIERFAVDEKRFMAKLG